MKTLKNNISIILFTLFITLGYNLKIYSHKPLLKLSKEDSALNLDSDLLSIFSLGQKRLISSLLWITTLLESDIEHYKGDDKNSWMFLRFKTIAGIDPWFLMNYQFGGQYLNIVKDDLTGSEIIFSKGLSFYPDDYELNLYSGFLYVFELKNFENGYYHYNKIKNNPSAPKYIPSLLVKLKYSQTGDKSLAIEVISDLLNKYPNSQLESKFKKDLYALTAEGDLDCLNSGNTNCSLLDIDGNPYVKKGNIYVAPKDFKVYKLNF
jgi:hypothetical protein